MAVAGSLTYETKIDKNGFEKGLNSLKSTSNKIMGTIKTAITTVATSMVALGTYAIKVGSNFEAGMSKVQAISGATGEEIEKLTEKAKEMGSKTKFSATESAEAFQYMAMAGWKTGDMLDGIEGLMNLAAASGEDLASVSDIVTDALTAFGLQAKDSAHFADVLAKASSNSNTNVGLMGATFKYVAPIAGSMKYSIEDTAVAIGLMANAGIKGEQAGTALRSMLTRLVKPPKEAATALDKLNISATNSDGTMKPLSQTLQELRKKFAKLDDSQKAAYASSIAGTEAMSGMLAIVNASDSDFNKLTKSINNAEGASKEMADTMNDNVKGAFTLLKSNIESVGIKIFEKMKVPLKNLINTISKYVSQIPGLLKNVYNWVVKNQNAIKILVKVVASLTAGYIAYKTTLIAIKAINLVQNVINTASAFLSLIPAIRSAKDVMTLLNMTFAANPIGLVIAAVTALAAGLVFLATRQSEANKKAKEFAEEMSSYKNSVEEYNNDIDKATEANLVHLKSVSELKDELTTLVDENGKVKEGYKGRVDFILTELNKALGTEYKLNGDIVQSYKDLQSEIDATIEKRRAEIILEAEEKKYAEALDKRTEATEKQREALKNLGMSYEDAKKLYQDYVDGNIKASKDEKETLKNKIKAYEDAVSVTKGYVDNIKKYEEDHAKFIEGKYDEIGNTITVSTQEWSNQTLNELTSSISEQKKALDDYSEMYKAAGDEVSKQNAEQARINLENLAAELAIKTSTIKELGMNEVLAWKDIAAASYETYSKELSNMAPETQAKINEVVGVVNMDKSIKTSVNNLANEAVNEFEKGGEANEKALNTIQSYLNGLSDMKKRELLKQAGVENVDAVLDELNRGDLSEENGKNILQGLKRGLNNSSLKSSILGIASGLAQAVNKAFTGKNGWDEHSPSKKMKKFAEYYIQPISDVMNKRKKEITNTAEQLASSINDSIVKQMNADIIQKMQNAVLVEVGSINAKASLQSNKEQPKTITNYNDKGINVTQNFYDKQATPYEQQKQSKEQLRRLKYGLQT